MEHTGSSPELQTQGPPSAAHGHTDGTGDVSGITDVEPGASSDSTAAAAHPPTARLPQIEPTVLTMQDLLDLPRQVLPDETYTHLKIAGREAILAAASLLSSIRKGMRSRSGADKTAKRINVE